MCRWTNRISKKNNINTNSRSLKWWSGFPFLKLSFLCGFNRLPPTSTFELCNRINLIANHEPALGWLLVCRCVRNPVFHIFCVAEATTVVGPFDNLCAVFSESVIQSTQFSLVGLSVSLSLTVISLTLCCMLMQLKKYDVMPKKFGVYFSLSQLLFTYFFPIWVRTFTHIDL